MMSRKRKRKKRFRLAKVLAVVCVLILIDGLDGAGIKIWQYRCMGIDLTQTSYSTIPSVDLEVGDRASTHGPEKLQKIAEGIRDGVDAYFGF